MARLSTVGALVLAAQEDSDTEGQTFLPWKKWLSRAYARLWTEVAKTGYRYFETAATVTTDGSASSFALPSDHFASTTVTRVVAPDDRRPLRRAGAQQQVTWVHQAGAGIGVGSEAYRWCHIGTDLWLGPQKPPAGQVYEHRYIPQPTDLSAAADGASVDLVTPDGETFVISAMMTMAIIRMRMDPRDARGERDAAEARVRDYASMRSLHEGHRFHVDDEDGGNIPDPADWRR